MPRVRALSNHPYRGQMRIKGTEYEAADADLDVLMALQRVVPVQESRDDRAYSTREMHASAPPAASARVRRRAREPTEPAPPLPSPDED